VVTEAIRVYCGSGQGIVVVPFILSGAMGPVSTAASVSQALAEAMMCCAYSQLVRPGAPFVLGNFLSSMSLKSGAPTFGMPEPVMSNYIVGQLARRLNLPSARVIGLGTQLDTIRFRSLIAQQLQLPPTQLSALILGEHGDSMVPIWSSATVAGLPLEKVAGWTPHLATELFTRTKGSGAEVIKRKGGAGFAVGIAIPTANPAPPLRLMTSAPEPLVRVNNSVAKCGVQPATFSSGSPATVALDQIGTMLSPCSPKIKADNCVGGSCSCCAIKLRKRIVSNCVPRPITRADGRLRRRASWPTI